jgi:hypothetical protein
MQKLFVFIAILASCLIFSCSQNKSTSTQNAATTSKNKNIIKEEYELVLPSNQKHLLILFPCFPCNAERTKTEFDIIEKATEKGIAVLMMNFNKHLWLSDAEKKELESIINQAIKENKINTENIFIGGFSSGGNVSLLLTNYLKSTNSTIHPKGVFIVDSPIDLLGLYENSVDNIEKNYSEVAVGESKWIVGMFDAEFGVGDSSLQNYEEKSPYISKTHSLMNLNALEDVKIRFYSEPDTLWWKENRQTEYEGTNAYYIEQLTSDLTKKYGIDAVEYIKTQNKGYRSNGERHPHSWSIVDKEGLINWILKE